MKIKFLVMQVKMNRITLELVPEEYRALVAEQLGGNNE